MGTVSFRVPDEVKARMEEHDEINWSEVLRNHVEGELQELEARNIAHAVAVSERLSQAIDAEDVAAEESADIIRSYRETRHSGTDSR